MQTRKNLRAKTVIFGDQVYLRNVTQCSLYVHHKVSPLILPNKHSNECIMSFLIQWRHLVVNIQTILCHIPEVNLIIENDGLGS